MNDGLASLIALVGADGAGKSTLVRDLAAHLSHSRPALPGYLGLGSGQLGQKIARWPVIGKWLFAFLEGKARQARDPQGSIPGLLTALVLYRYSLKRRRRFEAMMDLRRAGIVVVTDRYPQNEVPGFYDGPGLSAARTSNPLITWLAVRERRLYADMAKFSPTLVLRLNIDMATALNRKPDHDAALVQRKIDATPKLRFNGAPIVEIDATQPYDHVLAEAIRAIDTRLGG